MFWSPGLLMLPLLAGLGSAMSGLPENLRVEGINTKYMLKWDWDYRQNPHVTFSVMKSYFSQTNWRFVEGCENITASECNVSNIDTYLNYKFNVTVYNNHTDEHNSNIAIFSPPNDTVMGPPTHMNLTIHNNDIYISVGAPEGFKDIHLLQSCTWMFHLESWKNSTPMEVTTIIRTETHFDIKSVESSTTYCARAYTRCKESNRTGLYSAIYCITTGPRSYMTELIIGLVFGATIVIAVFLYICLCPLKRYLKHVFFPKSKLPSSIEQDSPQNYIKRCFLLQEEETTDKCYIMQISPVETEATTDKNSLGAKGRDSGNCSNEDESTGNSAAPRQ